MSGKLCRDVRLEIDQSELQQPLSASSEAHVGACVGCATFRDERVHLRELVGGLQAVTTPAIVVAAVLLIAVGAVVLVSQKNRSQNPAVVSDKGSKRIRPTPRPTE